MSLVRTVSRMSEDFKNGKFDFSIRSLDDVLMK